MACTVKHTIQICPQLFDLAVLILDYWLKLVYKVFLRTELKFKIPLHNSDKHVAVLNFVNLPDFFNQVELSLHRLLEVVSETDAFGLLLRNCILHVLDFIFQNIEVAVQLWFDLFGKGRL